MGCSSSTSAGPPPSNGYPQQQRPPPQQQNHHYQQQQQQQQMHQAHHQHQQPQQNYTSQAAAPDRQTLERYLALEREIHSLEGKNVLKGYKLKETEYQDLCKTVTELEKHYKTCVQQTAKEKADVDNMNQASVKSFFKDQATFDETLSKEQEEYLEALNNQEMAKKDLEGVTKQRDAAAAELEQLKQHKDGLEQKYQQQDELLAGIFDGNYGSETENMLEMELDVLLNRKQRISAAKYKWSNARVLLQHACNQLAFAVRRWGELAMVQPENTQARYTMATEARNNLIAANQNIVGAQRYLHTIDFPYCKPPEMETLSRATKNIYTDMTTNQRHAHALNCYSTTHKRSAALLQWFDHVINGTINKDLVKAQADVKTKQMELRRERLKLIKDKIIEAGGNKEDLDIDRELEIPDEADEEIAAVFTEPDKVSNAGDLPGELSKDSGSNQQDGAAPTPLPLNELAPTPNMDDLFGDIDDLKKKHAKELEEFNKAQDVNKARMEQGLQEKLQARRTRQKRLEEQ